MTATANDSFDYHPRTRIVFGEGVLSRLGALASELNGRRALVVTDAGIVGAGHADHARESLARAGLETWLFPDVVENPTTLQVEACAALAREVRADLLVGLGGGSSLDTAKGCNFLVSNGGRMQDYWGSGKARGPMLPGIAVPTTAGTGSECQSYALISDAETHVKMACGDPKAAPRVALLDPTLTLTQPREVTVNSGIDALTHAVETAVTRGRNALSLMLSRDAFRMCLHGLPRVLAQPDDLEARGMMQLGAAFAGMAIENSMLGAAHAAANPLTARYGVVHGQAVAVMLPWVVRHNGQGDDERALYARHLQCAGEHVAVDDAPERMAELLESMCSLAGLPPSLAAWDVRTEDLPTLAQEAAKQWTARHNPRDVNAEDFGQLYRLALAGRAAAAR